MDKGGPDGGIKTKQVILRIITSLVFLKALEHYATQTSFVSSAFFAVFKQKPIIWGCSRMFLDGPVDRAKCNSKLRNLLPFYHQGIQAVRKQSPI